MGWTVLIDRNIMPNEVWAALDMLTEFYESLQSE